LKFLDKILDKLTNLSKALIFITSLICKNYNNKSTNPKSCQPEQAPVTSAKRKVISPEIATKRDLKDKTKEVILTII